MKKWQRETNFSWSNWTFGFWFEDKKFKTRGIDLGPLNFTWIPVPVRRKTNLGKVIPFDSRSPKKFRPVTDPAKAKMDRKPKRGEYPKPVTKATGWHNYDSGPVNLQDRMTELKARRDCEYDDSQESKKPLR